MLLNAHRNPYRPADRARIGLAHAAEVRSLLDLCPAHRPTPLLSLPVLAADLGLGGVRLKMEAGRMGLGSFKPLGGAYAVARLVLTRAGAALGRSVAPADLASPEVRAFAAGLTFACASAGNHGLSVAAGARAFGARAVVYLSAPVPELFALRLRDQGATVVRTGTTYEDSMAEAMSQAARQGWDLVSDSSWPGYVETPLQVKRGYTILLEEAAEAMDAGEGPATHVFVQAGVGGLAAAAAAYLRDRWGEAFRFVVVEPAAAPCLLESVRAGRPVAVTGAPTGLGRLDCKEPSLLAFELLARLADAFVLIEDSEAHAAALRLAGEGAQLSACGAAGAAGLIAACADPRLGLTTTSRVLLIGTEAPEGAAQ